MTEHAEIRFSVWRGLELLAVLVSAVSIAGLFAMRLGVFYAWQIWLIGFLCAYFYSRLTTIDLKPIVAGPPVWHLVIVVAVALLFRLTPYIYQLGGQDEGIYTNMAAHLIRTGGLQPFDAVLEGISKADVREAYLQGNYHPKHYMPGIYGTSGGLEFQFYHLFPVWLAMFGAILGVENIGYGLTFLSLVSLLFFQRLAHILTNSPKAGLVAGLLLALNPLHAFFSKFPVTEVATLAFSTISFTFLAMSWKAPEGTPARRYLILSLAALAMLFMTRISGFLYLPLVLGVMFLALLLDRGLEARRRLVQWAIGALVLYSASVLYGLRWSGIYSRDIYTLSFEPLMGAHWPAILAVLACTIMAFWMMFSILAWKETRQRWMRHAVDRMAILLPVVIFIATAIALWKAYKLGYSDAYADHPWYGKVFNLSHRGRHSVQSISLIASAFYLSPFMLLAFYAACVKRRIDPALTVLLVFVAGIYSYVAVLQWVLPYQPYYARYLASEFVPYVILFIVSVWAMSEPGRIRRFIAFALVISGLWGGILSAMQLGKNEHEGVAPSLVRLSSHFDPKDIVFLDASLTAPLAHELKTAMVYTYGLNVVTVKQQDLGEHGYAQRLSMPYHDVFYVTRNPVAPAGFTELDSIDFIEKNYCHTALPPVKICTRSDSRLMLYKQLIRPPSPPGETAMEYSPNSPEIGTLVGIKQDDRLVANGRPGFVMYGPYQPLGTGKYVLEIRGISSTPFVLDMSGNKGANTIHSGSFTGGQQPASRILARVDFELKDSVSDLEVRINVPAGSDIQIDGYKILYR